MATTKPVSKAEIAAAAEALKLNVPVRRAERKGSSILLHTRAGTFTYTPPAKKKTTKE